MIKTDVENYYRGAPGSVVHVDNDARENYLRQKKILGEKKAMQEQINNLSSEIDELKQLVRKLIDKE